jgi:ABC-type amino acid transport substrate-binding protein
VLVVLDTIRPEFFSMDAAWPGFDREVLEGFARRHHLRLEIVALPSWDNLIPSLLAGKGDVIAGGFRDSPARRQLIAFSAEVFPSRMLVVTRKPHRVVKTIKELREEKVGTMRGTAMAEAVMTAGVPKANFDDGIPVGSFAQALRSGRITAAAWSIERAMPAQREDPDLQFGMFLGGPGSLAFATAKGDTQLLAALNEHLDAFRKSGAWSQLVVRYFGANSLKVLQQARSETATAP